jgi:hypothetical protein
VVVRTIEAARSPRFRRRCPMLARIEAPVPKQPHSMSRPRATADPTAPAKAADRMATTRTPPP